MAYQDRDHPNPQETPDAMFLILAIVGIIAVAAAFLAGAAG